MSIKTVVDTCARIAESFVNLDALSAMADKLKADIEAGLILLIDSKVEWGSAKREGSPAKVISERIHTLLWPVDAEGKKLSVEVWGQQLKNEMVMQFIDGQVKAGRSQAQAEKACAEAEWKTAEEYGQSAQKKLVARRDNMVSAIKFCFTNECKLTDINIGRLSKSELLDIRTGQPKVKAEATAEATAEGATDENIGAQKGRAEKHCGGYLLSFFGAIGASAVLGHASEALRKMKPEEIDAKALALAITNGALKEQRIKEGKEKGTYISA